MKISNLFDLVTDSRDVLDFFEGVETQEQLVSRLERLKRQGTEELLACIDGLRGSVTSLLDDALEMSTSIDDEEDEDLPDDSELDEILEEKQNQREETERKEEIPPVDPPPKA